MSDLTVKELKWEASRVKREIDTLEKAAYGMTFEELLRLLAGGNRKAWRGKQRDSPIITRHKKSRPKAA